MWQILCKIFWLWNSCSPKLKQVRNINLLLCLKFEQILLSHQWDRSDHLSSRWSQPSLAPLIGTSGSRLGFSRPAVTLNTWGKFSSSWGHRKEEFDRTSACKRKKSWWRTEREQYYFPIVFILFFFPGWFILGKYGLQELQTLSPKHLQPPSLLFPSSCYYSSLPQLWAGLLQ